MAIAHRIEIADLWKSRAQVLQLRLKQRLRVAVDQHCRRHQPIFSDGYFSSKFKRWLTRFRDFREGSIQSSSAFYRKRVSKDFKCDDDSVIVRMLQSVAVPLLGNMCHVFMNGLNRVQVYGLEKLHDALLHRPANKPLLTVSNHVASVDDPFVIASLLPPKVLLDARNLRWTLCASDRCFRNPVTSAFFRSVKVLPVSRGDGIYQKGMDLAIAKLNSGGWVHIFPEGSRSRDGGKTMGSSKRGVGRLVLDADTLPVVIPFVHTGMQEIMPIGANFPRIGKTVTVLVGDPIHFDDLLNAEALEDMPRGKLYDAVASRIGNRLLQLKVQVEKLAMEQSIRLQALASGSAERVSDMLNQVDWDSFGMGSYMYAEDKNNNKSGSEIEPNTRVLSHQDPFSSNKYIMKSQEYGIMSRMHAYFDSTELLGFAARGLLTKHSKAENNGSGSRYISNPLRIWQEYFNASLLQANAC